MLKIESKPTDEMIADGINSFPDECCGFMFGKEEGDMRTVTTSLIVHNSKEGDKRRRFEISPMDYMHAERYADENNLLLLGIYHSHPNHPSIPSEHDRVAAQVYFSYVIVSIKEKTFNTIQSWRLNESSQFEEEQIIP
ncbi:MAG: M67 family metallopeptidase [Ferruginibacter sp.]